jgi:hypothetical protein
MESAIHIVIYVFAAIVIVGIFIFGVIDMIGRVDFLEEKFPQLGRILARRSALVAFLIVAIFLLIGNGYELITKELPTPSPPVIQIKPPQAPVIQIQPQKKSPPAAEDKSAPLDRFLNAEQKERLFNDLKRVAADPRQKDYITVTIAAAFPHDRESSRLVYQLTDVFYDAGWNVISQQAPNYEQQTSGQIPLGIWVSASNNMAFFVESTLINVGLNADGNGKPLPSGFKGVLVLVGYKSAAI